MDRFTYAVTFEFDNAKPETIRGEISATEASGAARKAVVAAKTAKPNMHFRSMVILLERAGEA